MEVLQGPMLGVIRRAAASEDAVDLDDVLLQLVGRVAVHFEAQGWAHPREVLEAEERGRGRGPRHAGDAGSMVDAGRATGLAAAASRRGETCAMRSAGGADAAATTPVREKWEKRDFWRRWEDWKTVIWCREAEEEVRRGINEDVLKGISGREVHDLDAALTAVIGMLSQWRGRVATEADLDGPIKPLLQRLWLRWVAGKYQPNQRWAALGAASAAMESAGLSQEQLSARSAADRAALLTGGGGGGGYAQASALSSLPGGAPRGVSAGSPVRAGRSRKQWVAPPFAGLCYGCHQRGHRRQECPSLNGSTAPQTAGSGPSTAPSTRR